MRSTERDALLFHLVFAGIGALLLWAPLSWSLGLRVLIFVGLYNVAIPLVAANRNHDRWTELWAFLLPLSLLQVIPDWFLVDVAGSLRFPPQGIPEIGPVPGHMALMWVVALFPVLFVGERLHKRTGWSSLWAVVPLGLVVFGASEALVTRIPVWEAVGVATYESIALYVLPAEVLLCVVADMAWRKTSGKSLATRLGVSVLVMMSYLGALCTSYLFIEVAGLV